MDDLRVEQLEGSPVKRSLDRARLIQEGWDQGAILVADALSCARYAPPSEGRAPSPWAGAVIITHSCDVVNESYEDEPVVEVIPFEQLNRAARRELTAAQHPRELEIPDDVDGTTSIRLAIRDRVELDRARLLAAGHAPYARLGHSAVRVLIEWVRRRYDRPALPEAFARRVKHTKIRDALLERREHFGRLYIALDPWTEVGDDEPYEVGLRLILKPSAVRNMTQSRSELTVLLRRIVNQLANVEGVVLQGVHDWPDNPSKSPTAEQLVAVWDEIVRRPEQATLAEMLGYKPFNPEALD